MPKSEPAKQESKAQQAMNEFAKYLSDNGMTPQQIEKTLDKLNVHIAAQIEAKAITLMNDQDRKDWRKFLDNKPNPAQQLLVLNAMLKKRSGRGIEELQDEIIIAAMKMAKKTVSERSDLQNKIEKLSNKDVKQAQLYLQNGDFDKAKAIIEG